MDNNTNGYGISGFVISIVSLFFLPFILGIVSIILGGANAECGLGRAAMIIGAISIFWAIIVSCVY